MSEKPKQYQIGIDTFERMRANDSYEAAMGFIRNSIDKYNTRKKGQDKSDYEKIKAYCDEALWWIENKSVAEFNGGVKSVFNVSIDMLNIDDSNGEFKMPLTVKQYEDYISNLMW